MKALKVVVLTILAPAMLAGQQDPVARLREVLPPAVADQVIAVVTTALNRGLPPNPVALRALEGAAKGRTGEEITAAAQAMADDLARAEAALEQIGRTARADEIEAATAAMQLGVDGEIVSGLASSAPSGRSLTVPLAVLGALVNRGIPADEALAAVLARLEARATNAELAAMPAGWTAARGTEARGARPAHAGPPSWVPSNGGRPGRRPFAPPAQP